MNKTLDDDWMKQYSNYREKRAFNKNRLLKNKLKIRNEFDFVDNREFIRNIERQYGIARR